MEPTAAGQGAAQGVGRPPADANLPSGANLIDIKAWCLRVAQSGCMDRFPAAEDGPQYELIALARTMDDLSAEEKTTPRLGGIVEPLICVAAVGIAMLAFIGWLLFF